MTIQTASAWVQEGVLVKIRAHYYECVAGASFCMKSVDPYDLDKTVGDRVLTNFPDRGVENQVIIGIESSEDPSEGNGSSMEVANEATGEIDIIITGFE